MKFHKEGLCFEAGGSDPMSELMLSMLGAVAQFELSMIQERRKASRKPRLLVNIVAVLPIRITTSKSGYYALKVYPCAR